MHCFIMWREGMGVALQDCLPKRTSNLSSFDLDLNM